MNPFFKEEQTDTPMFRCPNCKEIVRVDNTKCRYCGSTIDEATARRLNLDFQRVTNAVASANTFKQSIWLAVLLMVASPVIFLVIRSEDSRYLLISAAPIVFLGYAISWQRKYGRLETSDKEYPDAFRDMRRTLLVWSIALVIHVAVMAYALSSGWFPR
jgi:hypothetical protein